MSEKRVAEECNRLAAMVADLRAENARLTSCISDERMKRIGDVARERDQGDARYDKLAAYAVQLTAGLEALREWLLPRSDGLARIIGERIDALLANEKPVPASIDPRGTRLDESGEASGAPGPSCHETGDTFEAAELVTTVAGYDCIRTDCTRTPGPDCPSCLMRWAQPEVRSLHQSGTKASSETRLGEQTPAQAGGRKEYGQPSRTTETRPGDECVKPHVDSGEVESGSTTRHQVGHEDAADLMVDEFKRIAACPGATPEIVGICERAIKGTVQRVPVIEQRDQALKAANTLRNALANVVEHPKHRLSKDGAVAALVATNWLAGNEFVACNQQEKSK